MTRREWCTVLAKLVSPSFPLDAQRALLDMLPALAHMPDSSFTAQTMTHVACWKRRQSVPAFDEIVAALRDFRVTSLPDLTLQRLAPPAPEPDRPAPSPEEQAYVAERMQEMRGVMAEHARAREANARALPVLPDVSLKGEALRRVREARLGVVRQAERV